MKDLIVRAVRAMADEIYIMAEGLVARKLVDSSGKADPLDAVADSLLAYVEHEVGSVIHLTHLGNGEYSIANTDSDIVFNSRGIVRLDGSVIPRGNLARVLFEDTRIEPLELKDNPMLRSYCGAMKSLWHLTQDEGIGHVDIPVADGMFDSKEVKLRAPYMYDAEIINAAKELFLKVVNTTETYSYKVSLDFVTFNHERTEFKVAN